MAWFENMSQSARRSALAVIMLVILLLGTGIAWMIVAARSAVREGETWYLIARNGKPLGWRVIQRESAAGGGETGYDISYLGDGSAVIIFGRWRLNADATRGRYVSERAGIQGARMTPPNITRISYDHPMVRITREFPGGILIGEPQKIDESYIPEGKLLPVIVEVAGTGRAFDGEIVDDRQGRLVLIAVEPEDCVSREVEGSSVQLAAAIVRWPAGDSKTLSVRYLVADDGGIVLIEHIDAEGKVVRTTTRASLDAIRKHFPNAHQTRSAMMREDPLG